jgi:drug/metabolite transporter (DMT)-like permease
MPTNYHERSADRSAALRARLLIVSAAALFSTGGAAIKAADLSAWQVAAFRSAVASLALVLLLPEARRKWSMRAIPVAVVHALTMLLFVQANKLTTAANAIFLQDTAPLFVLLIAPLLLKEPVRRSDVLFIAATGFGMALFFLAAEPTRVTAPDPFMGNVLAAMSAVTWASTITGLRWLGRGGSPSLPTVVLGNILTAAIALNFAFPLAAWTLRDATVILWLGIFQVGLAYTLFTRAIPHVPAVEATTILLLEPALSPLWAWMAHGEKPSAQALAGGTVIIAATAVKTWWQSRDSTEP